MRTDERHRQFLEANFLWPRNLSGKVFDELGREIVGGLRSEGSTLPREEELTATFGVSRSVIRDAIRMLAAKGLVETRTKRGTIVRPRARWQLLDHDILRWALTERSDRQLFTDLIEMRQVVEPAAAQLAAARATAEDLERIEEACRMMRAHVQDEQGFLEADVAFHMAVLGSSHNAALIQLGQAVKAALFVAFERSMLQPDAIPAAFPLHQAVFESIRARNPLDAGNAMMVCVRQDGSAPRAGGESGAVARQSP